ncbi:prostaglandin E synthase-like [Amphibalanus amphitrite]|uniref:prostaglandin E synthase-like n=1 Tax=Amphibalanus amphitrite TaxID=1232801 RepID=UPI001C90966F|nr:prostaglandin E synthase-like [Amphibalanus amphitrite]
MAVTLNIDADLLKTYVFWGTVLIVKVLMMAFLTGRQRMKKKIFANPEDAQSHGGKVKLDDPDVERVRRAHLNDLENVVPFLLLTPLYLSTGPAPWIAANLIRGFAAARIVHTIGYLNEMSIRGLGFLGGIAICIFMAGSTLYSCCSIA